MQNAEIKEKKIQYLTVIHLLTCLEYHALRTPALRIMVRCHGTPHTVSSEGFSKISPKRLAQNMSFKLR